MNIPGSNNSKRDTDYFNSFKDGYNPYSDEDFDILLEKIVVSVRGIQNPSICEMGCASGQFSSEFEKRIKDQKPVFSGVDIAEKVLELYPFNKIHSSAFNVPVNDSCFDLVCFCASLHHLDPIEKAINEASRVLKPGGILYCFEPNFFHPHRRYFMNLSKLYRVFKKPNDIPINPVKLAKLLEKNNFERIRSDFINVKFSNPGILQSIQNRIASTVMADKHKKFFMPWFILIANKMK
jgi:ubiquinone/menaquinone biosynthesis C-methylase UbiE